MKKEYISLKEATRYCNYSSDYLKLRVRQGKLRALKMGRNWFTTRKWLEEYRNNLESNKAPHRRRDFVSSSSLHCRSRKWRMFFKEWLFLFLIIFLIAVGVFLLLDLPVSVLEKIIPVRVIEIH